MGPGSEQRSISTISMRERDMSTQNDVHGQPVRQAWEAPTVKVVGTVGDVLKGGGGKQSMQPADPGEIRKPKPPTPETPR